MSIKKVKSRAMPGLIGNTSTNTNRKNSFYSQKDLQSTSHSRKNALCTYQPDYGASPQCSSANTNITMYNHLNSRLNMNVISSQIYQYPYHQYNALQAQPITTFMHINLNTNRNQSRNRSCDYQHRKVSCNYTHACLSNNTTPGFVFNYSNSNAYTNSTKNGINLIGNRGRFNNKYSPQYSKASQFNRDVQIHRNYYMQNKQNKKDTHRQLGLRNLYENQRQVEQQLVEIQKTWSTFPQKSTKQVILPNYINTPQQKQKLKPLNLIHANYGSHQPINQVYFNSGKISSDEGNMLALNSIEGKKTISSLTEADTVQSKYIISETPRQNIEQSQIVFKGSRDIAKIVPMKLIYDDQDTHPIKDKLTKLPIEKTCNNVCSNKILQNQAQDNNKTFPKVFVRFIPKFQIKLTADVQIIKRSNSQSCLIKFADTQAMFSLITIQNSFVLEYLNDSSFLTWYSRHKQNKNTTIFFGEPYQYTLNQLYTHNKLSPKNIEIVMQHLQPGIEVLCQERYPFFEIKGIENYIFYMHGKFKFMPVYQKGKVQCVKDLAHVYTELQTYLLGLLLKKDMDR